MKKIEFDTVNGVFEVADFQPETERVDNGTLFEMKDVFDRLREDFQGTRGAIVDIKTFRTIDTEYGIKKLGNSASDIARKGGSAKTEAKKKSSAENGKKGGRPKKKQD